jgi:transcriptional regulator with XRE-family HTH domain
MSDAQRRQDLADFLRTRRMRLTPEQLGLSGGGRRRTPGLRREEVAQRANVGVSWYTLLEQGRDIHPSREVLQSIAGALQLTPDERQHLFILAEQQPVPEPQVADEQVSPALRRVLDGLNPFPAYIIGRHWEYLAWNTAAEHVMMLSKSGSTYGYNAIWRMFADPDSHQLLRSPNWEQVAQKVLEEFRAESARYAHEAWFQQLVADLQRVSPEFRAWWPQHGVRGIAETHKELDHPVVGSLKFEHTTLQVPTMPHLKLMVYTPLPDTDTAEKIERLLSHAAARSEAQLSATL